jgi:hypothetical protein
MAMRELRDRIQRERQQLQELETKLAHRKPFQQSHKPSPAASTDTETIGTLRISTPASL